jgi:cytochrome c
MEACASTAFETTGRPTSEIARASEESHRFVPERANKKKENGMREFMFVVLLAVACSSEVRAQDAAAGEKVFGVCKACHQIGENAKNGVGPVLNGLIGRKSGSVPGYSYSAANKDSGITWDEATFREYIKDPKAKIPGTKMIYAGLKDEQKTNDLVAFLKQFDADGKKK